VACFDTVSSPRSPENAAKSNRITFPAANPWFKADRVEFFHLGERGAGLELDWQLQRESNE